MTTIPIPAELPAARPVWRSRTSVVVVGSGAAGLSATLRLARAGVATELITRAALDDSATAWAQGGLAAVWSADDSAEAHVEDTLVAGAGLCDPEAVAELVEQAPAAIRRLIALGARFDTDATGLADLHLEGGHHARRILHAGGDRSGAEVQRTLTVAVRAAADDPGSALTIRPGTRLVDLLTDAEGACCGVRVLDEQGRIGEILAGAVVLAAGGVGQAWGLTTNPAGATGDGLAAALRAGAAVRDVEFVQFHPTLLAVPGERGVLISEAVRGEGARLLDLTGNPVMAGIHPLGDLAPRDVVSAAMQQRMAETGTEHCLLDATGFGETRWREHFPAILAMCRERGVDPVTEPIPVRPGAHYLCGGIAADLDGRTSLPGLYAVGEVAGTGVQGANRLASNSVTEALVAGDRVGALLVGDRFALAAGESVPRRGGAAVAAGGFTELRPVLDAEVGVRRSAPGLRRALDRVRRAPRTADTVDRAILDATNLHTIATLVATAALLRTESRGCHRRADHPETRAEWLGRTEITLDRTGRLATAFIPLPNRTEEHAA
ncbi:L-aspartate oxidase [Enemella evansiae]|uniref:L-aspartate oxidase n=1 Tax=Enemella evansiae TaxID=2016499 RepID=UPI000B960D53|nr:L-aspartate oxidase [Enemella evansiae]OYO14960.1 L-aspartate oxidase [Enemella evansiae]OYO18751.1 L-aspartate oxidase [Enemella evansiae]